MRRAPGTTRSLAVAALAGALAGALAASPVVGRAQDASPFARAMDAGLAARRSGDVDAAIRSFRRAIDADTSSARARFELGYALLQTTRRADAAAAFEDGLRRDPTHVDALRQLGYLRSALGRLRESVAAFDSARALGATDLRDRLEVGYVARRLGDRALAERAFADAEAGGGAIGVAAAQARADLRAGRAAGASREGLPRFADFYAAPLYQTRFSNVIAQAIGRVGIVLEDRTRLSPYLSLRVSRDSRSRGGPQPVIFSDNVVVPAVGVRMQPLRGTVLDGLYLYAEGGPALKLVHASGGERTRDDVRAGAFLIKQWQATPAGRAGHLVPLTLASDLYADASWYSRFDRDAIAFGQLRESLRLVERGGRGVDLFARLWTVVDSRGVYYNNAVEVGPGIALYPEPSRRAFVFVESLWGRYLARPDPGVRRTYHDARVTIILAAYAWWRPRAR